MPVKNKRFPTNNIYEGKITGLDEDEKKVLEESIDKKTYTPIYADYSSNYLGKGIIYIKDTDTYITSLQKVDDENIMYYVLIPTTFYSVVQSIAQKIGGLQSYDDFITLTDEGFVYTYYKQEIDNEPPTAYQIKIDEDHIPVYEQNIAEKMPVKANPTESATETLSKLTIADKVYSIPSSVLQDEQNTFASSFASYSHAVSDGTYISSYISSSGLESTATPLGTAPTDSAYTALYSDGNPFTKNTNLFYQLLAVNTDKKWSSNFEISKDDYYFRATFEYNDGTSDEKLVISPLGFSNDGIETHTIKIPTRTNEGVMACLDDIPLYQHSVLLKGTGDGVNGTATDPKAMTIRLNFNTKTSTAITAYSDLVGLIADGEFLVCTGRAKANGTMVVESIGNESGVLYLYGYATSDYVTDTKLNIVSDLFTADNISVTDKVVEK